MVCKKCGQMVEEGFNNCPNCGESVNGKSKTKKPIFKKWWFWLIIVLAVVIILGSSGSSDDTDVQPDSSVSDTVIEDGTTTTTTTTAAGPAQTWEKDFYVDDFNEPTDEWFIRRSFTGKFSNSATTDSRLSGYVFIDAKDISIFLYEYNSHQVKNIYSRTKDYAISVRLADGTTKEFSGCIYSEGDRIMVNESQVSSLKALLKNGGDMKFYVYEKDNSVTNYLFEISTDNLNDVL